jgi:hypothetical protein
VNRSSEIDRAFGEGSEASLLDILSTPRLRGSITATYYRETALIVRVAWLDRETEAGVGILRFMDPPGVLQADSVAMGPGYMRGGLYRNLVARGPAWLRVRGITRIRLGTGAAIAQAIFERSGFRPINPSEWEADVSKPGCALERYGSSARVS